MEIPNRTRKIDYFQLFLYEFLGTIILVFAINMSKGDPFAIGLTLFTLIVITHEVSGAHFNPAVTVAVFIMEKGKHKKNLKWLALYFSAEILGAIVGVLFAHSIEPKGNWLKLARGPKVTNWGVAGIEIIGTFLLATAI
jgi:glycerol uptake facilitator-like aquaporin